MIYFDNAATTFPKPPAVIHEMFRCMKEYGGNPGRSGHRLSLAAAEAIFDTRTLIADFFGISKAENVIFTSNCTGALNLAIGGIARKGDHFLISNLEHNSVLRVVSNLCREKGMSFDVFHALASDDAILNEIDKKIRPNTKAVISTHASNICPRILPIARMGALCKKRNVLFVVDAAQSAGIYDISIMRDGISILCAPGHKGLYGPQGSGFAAIADDFDFSRLKPCVYGGNGKNSAEIDMGYEPPDSYEAGTLATPAIVGLGEGIRFVKERKRERIEMLENQLFHSAQKMLSDIPRVKIYLPEATNGSLLLLGFDGISPSEVAEKLSDHGICTRAGMHCAPMAHRALGTGGDALRISFSAMNTSAEVEAFTYILQTILRENHI
ncbi:MAG: aminotransferase class V-fold PLP-dependent enzyme [Clostridia bacterium]|nr:aminotransferase class V-fold PLP-dependent enzyme [Clostridia bacterium]